MQNTMQNTAAYDLNYFAQDEIKKEPKLYVAKHVGKRKGLKSYNKSVLKSILIATLMVTLIGAVLYMQSVDTMLSGEIAKQEEILLELESDYGYLNNEIEMRTNLINVEAYAISQLGLVKRDPSQTVYVHRGNESSIVYKQTIWEEVIGYFSGGVQNISSYIAPVE